MGRVTVSVLVGLCCAGLAFAEEDIPTPDPGSHRHCGIDALYQVCVKLGLPITYREILRACPVGEEGVSLLDLFTATQILGLSSAGLRMSMDELLAVKTPCIAFIPGSTDTSGHFLVVSPTAAGSIEVTDYPSPPYVVSVEEFARLWHGEALIVSRPLGVEFPPRNGPRVEIEDRVFDFGLVLQGELVEHEFVFGNTGNETLEIPKVASGCGCMTALLSASGTLPGDTNVLKVSLSTFGLTGRITKSIGMLTNDPENPQVVLSLVGRVRSEVLVSPGRIYYDSVNRHGSEKREIFLTDDGANDLLIEGVSCSSSVLEATWERCVEPLGQGDNRRYRVSLVFAPMGMEPGNFEGSVTIRTNTVTKKEIVIPVSAKVVGNIQAAPRSVYFGYLNAGETATRHVRLVCSDGRNIASSSLNTDLPHLTLDLRPASSEGTSFDLSVTYGAPSGSKGVVTGKVYLEDLEIPVFGIIR